MRYGEEVATAGIVPSIGSIGDLSDNALAESTIGLVKTELVHNPTRGPWASLSSFEFALAEYLEWCNNARLHGEPEHRTPTEIETDYLLPSPPVNPAGPNPQSTPCTERAAVHRPAPSTARASGPARWASHDVVALRTSVLTGAHACRSAAAQDGLGDAHASAASPGVDDSEYGRGVTTTPARRRRVFVSSAVSELAAERAAARRAIEILRLAPILSEAGNDEHERRPGLGDSDFFVGIYWQGAGPTAFDRGELMLARDLSLAGARPRLLYVKEPAPDRDPRLAAFVERLRRSGETVAEIAGPEDLAEQLIRDLAGLIATRSEAVEQDLPVGTVTFLFADVEDSTGTLERLGEVYTELLARFRRDGDAAVTRAGGVLVQAEGDGLFAAFPTADAALDAAVTAQRVYLSYPPPGPLMVRIGLHSGTGVVVDDSYAGIDVHRAARVADAGHGGQLLVSASARELIRDWGDARVTDLGWYELKGLSHVERLLQVTAPGLPQEFPPLRARPSARARLPRQLTPLLGREADVEAVAALLRSGVRLLTLIGPGGVGKTRLAVAAAEEVAASYPDGVGFVELAAVADADAMADVIVAGLGRSVEGSLGAEDVLVDELDDKRFLLVLDNMEQVVEGSPLLRRLLERLPRLQILVTSRVALQLSAERVLEVAPLGLPAAGAEPAAVAETAAVRLLVDRARAVRPDFAVDADNAAAVAELARRLDGIPLAIELAAVRLRLLEPTDLLDRLSSALDLAGAVDLPGRQRTLRAAIDWSVRLLSDPQRVLFARLGVFVDGWTLQAAEEVAGGPEIGDVAAALDTLAVNSMIRLESAPGGGARMRLLGPLQEYALESLAEAGELEAMRDRHAAHVVGWVEEYPRTSGGEVTRWRRRIASEWGNVHQALVWCTSEGDHRALARLLVALWPHLWVENRVTETLGWLEELRPHPERLAPEVRAHIVHIDGFFALEIGEHQRALALGHQALAAAETLGEVELAARTRLLLAGILPAFDLHDPDILPLMDRAIATFRERGDVVDLAYALNFQCAYLAATGDMEAARRAIEEALALSADMEALPVHAQSQTALGFVELIAGDPDAAAQHLAAAVAALENSPSREILSYVLDGYGWWALVSGDDIAGLTAIGAAEGLRDRLGLRAWPLAAGQLASITTLADSYASPDAQAARRAGRQLAPEAALAVVRIRS